MAEGDSSSEPHESQDVSPTSRANRHIFLKAKETAQPSGVYESPVKTSVDLDDGVIDVDVPFPDYITASFETAVSSPSSSGYLSTPGFGTTLDSFEQACTHLSRRVTRRRTRLVGCSITIQTFCCRRSLTSRISLPRSKPLCEVSQRRLCGLLWLAIRAVYAAERWVDIGTTLIVDATNFTVTRFRYRRLVRMKPTLDRSYSFLSGSVGSYNSSSTALLTPAPPPIISPVESHEDEFIEETIISRDDLLGSAVERVVATGTQGTGSETASTEASSRSTSHQRRERRDRRERSNSASAGTGSEEARHGEGFSNEVPRSRCKKVVAIRTGRTLSARSSSREIGRKKE